MADRVFIVSGARTPIGTFMGALKDVTPTDLGVIATREAINRSGVPTSDISISVFGNVIPTETNDLYLGRSIALGAGLPQESTGLTLNRLCGSGTQAIITAAMMIRDGDGDAAIAGGTESMTRAPFSAEGLRSGRKLGNSVNVDWLAGVLTDPFKSGAMGETAENIAERQSISRERQDEFALGSQRKAKAALDAGRFQSQIVAVEIKSRKGKALFSIDEHVKPDSSAEALASLRPAFRTNGTVTAGNASGLNDGAAAVVLVSEKLVSEKGLKPRARIAGWGLGGVAPDVMGLGPVKAVPVALKRAGISIADVDVIESNEAFAAQCLAVMDGLRLDAAKVNPNGGAIALGHPLGATGGILTVKAMYELERIGGRWGLITMCIGGGQGIALVIENLVR